MRISRFATPAVLAALASTFGPACESSECVDEVCFDDTGGASSAGRSGSGAAGDNPGGASNGGTGGLGSGGFGAGGSSAGTGGTAAGAAGAPPGGSSQTGIGGDLGGSDEGGAGAGGSGGEGGAPMLCDPTQSPTTESCLVSDEHAIFVSPLGTENASGSKSDPLLSLATAIARADAEDKVVIACSKADAHFTTPLELTGEIDARVYGGFTCDDTWTWSADDRTLIAPETGVALKLESVSGTLEIEGFEFRAADADATVPGASSVAAIATESEGVTFRRVTIAAGNGAAGRDGEEIAPFTSGNANGHAAEGEAGGDPRTSSQCGCATTGGQGGNSEISMNGDDGTPDYGGGKGGVAGTNCVDGVGRNGDPPPAATTPGAGAASLGSLNGVSWEPASGQSGTPGAPGQGGGGGAGAATGGGGGGACGGCGGKGGSPGAGGGASIALISINSNLVFSESRLETGDGGAGGNGASGQDGQGGGFGGTQAPGGCQGGNGGTGAPGGPGGGGAGGITVGILYRGGLSDTTTSGIAFMLGDWGARGQGGEPDGNFGVTGISANTQDADAD